MDIEGADMNDKELENIIKSKYCINASRIEKSDESTDGNVYIIKDENNNKYVIKVYIDLNHASSMVSLHTYVNGINLIAPSIISNNENSQITEYEGKYIVCYTFVDGVKLKEINLQSEIMIKIAEYLRKLHAIKDNRFNLKYVSFDVASDRKSVLHFDITKNNIFVDDENICFIDFDDAKFGPSVCDVAIALTNLFISKANGIDIHGMKNFIDAYYQDDMILKEKEIPLIKDAAIKWLQSIIDNPNFDTSTRAGLENKLKCWNEINMYNLT